jgi:glucokinase
MEVNDLVLSIDLGGTKCAAALVNRKGDLIRQQSIAIGGLKGAEVGSVISGQVEELLAHAALKHYQVLGIGISVPGISDQQRGTVWAPNIKGWDKYPLRQLLKDQLTREDIPIFIESDRGCALLGEHWLGAAKGTLHAIYLSVGTGIGTGIMVDGRIIKGSHDIAGATGWMALQRPFENKFKPYGNFEFYASGDGLVRAAEEFVMNTSSKQIHKRNIANLKAEDIFEYLEEKDPIAIRVIDQAIELWGMATANLVSLFNPEIIIFGGGVFGPGLQLLDRIYRESIRWAQPVAMRQVKYVASDLKGNAPILGAAFTVFNSPEYRSNGG